MPTTETKKTDAEEKKATHQSAAPKKVRKSRKKILIILTIIFLIIGLVWFLYWLLWGQFHEYTDDAYVSGNLVRVMPQVPGTVTAIYTDDTQLVQEGQTLVKLDDSDTRLQLDRAQAALANTVRKVRQYYDQVYQAQAAVTLRQADLDNARFDVTRRNGLVGEKAISREEMEHYATALSAAQAQFDLTKAQLDAATALVANTSLYNHPEVIRAAINLKNAYLNFYRTTIIAPVTGYVAKRNVQVGQQVTLGTSMMAIVPLKEVWIDANYKESQLERLRIGQNVVVTADAYGSVTFHGTIQGLSSGTGSAFDLLPPQNATGNWIKIVQRLPVRIMIDAEELKEHPLRIGLSVRVTANTFGMKGETLNKATPERAYYQTDVYEKELAEAAQLITNILHINAPDMVLSNSPGVPT
ncbi:MAG: efflux RND transporter periplasmic adaptor subunit [Pseudomonadota bacterium]